MRWLLSESNEDKGGDMLNFHESHGPFQRRTFAAYAMQSPYNEDAELAAGYCLDAVESMPAGATVRVEGDDIETFAAAERTYRGW